jgi:hypothetical protein
MPHVITRGDATLSTIDRNETYLVALSWSTAALCERCFELTKMDTEIFSNQQRKLEIISRQPVSRKT